MWGKFEDGKNGDNTNNITYSKGDRCYAEGLSKKEGVESDELCNILESGQGRLYHKDGI